MTMTKEMANKVYDVLVEECGANDSDMWRDMFVSHHIKDDCLWGGVSEWRFQGLLGFGGKFWICTSRGWDVNYYREDATHERDQMMRKANERLDALYKEHVEKLSARNGTHS